MKIPAHIVPPAPKGAVRMRKSGAGMHTQGVRRERARGAARRAAIRREVSL